MNPFGLLIVAFGAYLAYVGATGNSGALAGIVGGKTSTSTKTTTSTPPTSTFPRSLPAPGVRQVS